MDSQGNAASHKTRYSFYEASDVVDLINTAPPQKLNSVSESGTMETDETESSDQDKTLNTDRDKYHVRTNPSEEDASESKHAKDLSSSEHKMDVEMEGCGKQPGKPPRHEQGTNAYEKAIREALSYIRKRAQNRGSSTTADIGGLGWKNSNNGYPIPLSPGIDGSAALATATKLDNRLLSPPADVRKAASDMFRHHENVDGDSGDVSKPFEGLELAKPVDSLHSRESPVHMAGLPNGSNAGADSSMPHLSITPSSPASGKFHLNDTEASGARRQKLESERSMRRDVEIEKGVEQVLELILQRAESSNESKFGDAMEDLLSAMFTKQANIHDARVRKKRANNHDENGAAMDDSNHDSSLGGVDRSNAVDTSIRTSDSNEGMLEVEAIESGTATEDFFDELEEDESDQDDMVLGRLSAKVGGTTGVVLQDDENDVGNDDGSDQEDVHSAHEEEDNFDEEDAPPASPSLISSVTSAARRTSQLVASKLSFSSSNDQKVTGDIEVLVKELYSHMLIRHPSHKHMKNNKKDASLARWMSDYFTTSSSPRTDLMWDEHDPDEPGYVIHTFSRGKLQDIEHIYEDMVDQAGSEYAVAMKNKGKSHNKTGSDFERDLLDAEKMLDKEKNSKSSSATASKKKDAKDKAAKTKNPSDALMTNPNFPGAKAAGTGGVGDLEIYHLPIIYKAHQTGFEPTKDLVLQPDTVFAGQYYVQSELGSAAFSTAYRCVDLNSGNKSDDGEVYYDEVCLKVIKNTKDFFDQSLDEIKILELLRQTSECNEHNILEMKAFFYHKEHLIIVTELLRQNLFEFGKYIMEHDEPKYFTRSRLCYIARQCLVALSFVHKLGLVHSDIKPENILLASYSRARVKVIDFGSSCYLTDRQSSYIQSRSYRAPEVVLGLPYDGKIDVWSLGCVIAEMYTGQVTFQNDSVVSMLARIEAICGAFPRHMIEEGRQNGQFFTPTGLLYEKVESDEDSGMRMEGSSSFQDDDDTLGDSALFNVLQPKTTTMAERLGFDANLMSSKRKTWEEDEKALFTDFVTKLLTVDPDKRPTADEALEHPWILSGFNLTEEDLKYPPEE